jgi:hypothetical protein
MRRALMMLIPLLAAVTLPAVCPQIVPLRRQPG